MFSTYNCKKKKSFKFSWQILLVTVVWTVVAAASSYTSLLHTAPFQLNYIFQHQALGNLTLSCLSTTKITRPIKKYHRRKIRQFFLSSLIFVEYSLYRKSPTYRRLLNLLECEDNSINHNEQMPCTILLHLHDLSLLYL